MCNVLLGLEVEVHAYSEGFHQRIKLACLAVDFRIKSIPGIGECQQVLATDIDLGASDFQSVDHR
jgi:hypothetical protein